MQEDPAGAARSPTSMEGSEIGMTDLGATDPCNRHRGRFRELARCVLEEVYL